MNYLTMSEFAGDGIKRPRWGRFGNQLFQVAFLETYAAQHDCELQLPPWVGNELFNHRRPPVTIELPPRLEQTDHLEQAIPPRGDEYVNHDFRGYGQYHTSYYAPHKDFLRLLFQPTAAVLARLLPGLGELRERGRTRVGLHLRRGDYGRLIFYLTPVSWYLDWLAEHWDGMDDPVLFIATETPELVEEFRGYGPMTTADLGVQLSSELLPGYGYLDVDRRLRQPWQMDFFPDWYYLSQCEVVLAPNSTFSVTAAMFGGCAKSLFRSELRTQRFQWCDPWSMYPMQHERAEKFRDVPGVCLDETPYWRRLADGSFEELR